MLRQPSLSAPLQAAFLRSGFCRPSDRPLGLWGPGFRYLFLSFWILSHIPTALPAVPAEFLLQDCGWSGSSDRLTARWPLPVPPRACQPFSRNPCFRQSVTLHFFPRTLGAPTASAPSLSARSPASPLLQPGSLPAQLPASPSPSSGAPPTLARPFPWLASPVPSHT